MATFFTGAFLAGVEDTVEKNEKEGTAVFLATFLAGAGDEVNPANNCDTGDAGAAFLMLFFLGSLISNENGLKRVEDAFFFGLAVPTEDDASCCCLRSHSCAFLRAAWAARSESARRCAT